MFNELVSNLTNTAVFTKSVSHWVSHLSINAVIIMIMMIFMIIGAVDKMRGNKLGYGEQFEEGFNAMGPLAMAMAGVVAAAPVLAIILKPIIVPIYRFFGADASMFATTLLACDMGGYPLAMKMAANATLGNFSGLILGSMMGPTIVFTIPVALSIIKKQDRPYLGAGILAGLITIPIGCIAGGLVMNLTEYKISIGTILVNLIPVIIIAGLIVIGLWFKPDKMINGFNVFGKAVTIIITFFTAVAVFEYETGIRFPLMNLMVKPDANGTIPLESGLLVCGTIAIVLIGAFPMVKWITDTFGGALQKVGQKLGIDENSSAGLVANLANNIAMFNIMDKMNAKGKLLNVAFAVSAAFVFGDHLGFTAGVNPKMIFPVIVGKLVAGITALILANMLAPKLLGKIQGGQTADSATEQTGGDQ
ncbi:ethanolamine utilization protein, EutH [Pseudoramibacter alactolyticus ATCC 23263]|jgi:ethanolamine transporter|uniref:Ethanolamine utilization protein, EutH n=1 Tax=Pseudoramibacter alactolyticus ATCC 23263 TaxID=887929 RepID=E6MI89_9FIRM|nr:ethanolamine utilization protein EutH [Pseudoramibacter alactolyticus]EFV01241.1 ethanolamine utilization protein, EutH [Pseudoramibacter alactolyticus ATCC 23263]MBM6967534.1 ethanolamine utilization protein EutH [Pseudoramibacter alactolyticus]